MNTFFLILGGCLCCAFGFFIHALLTIGSERNPDGDIYDDEAAKNN